MRTTGLEKVARANRKMLKKLGVKKRGRICPSYTTTELKQNSLERNAKELVRIVRDEIEGQILPDPAASKLALKLAKRVLRLAQDR